MGGLISAIVFKSGKDKIGKIPEDLFSIRVKDIDGVDKTIGDYAKGKKAMIFVNVASKWGLTSVSYTALADLYEKYGDKGLEILGFPCNQFMGQESKCESEIKKFVVEEFGIKFPMFSKIEVNGKDTHEVYAYLKANTPSLNKGNNVLVNIPWNFSKFLVDSNGKVVYYSNPKEKPEKLKAEVEKMLMI